MGRGNAELAAHDFVELYNAGNAVLIDWLVGSVLFGRAWIGCDTISGAIQPGRYYWCRKQRGEYCCAWASRPDATGSIAMSGTAAKVSRCTADGSVVTSSGTEVRTRRRSAAPA
jgi:hypothetical protein